MTKKHLISLADHIVSNKEKFPATTVLSIADWCATQNVRFDRKKWLGYINDKIKKGLQ